MDWYLGATAIALLIVGLVGQAFEMRKIRKSIYRDEELASANIFMDKRNFKCFHFSMKEVGKIWMNGKLVPFKDAKVHVLTHALHYSTAIFEGLRCYNTPNGSAIFRLPEHVDRLFKSAKMYSMKMPYSKKQISDAIIKTVKESKLVRNLLFCTVIIFYF